MTSTPDVSSMQAALDLICEISSPFGTPTSDSSTDVDPLSVELVLRGCDDSTTISLHVTQDQLLFLRELETRFRLRSTYDCMPVLEVHFKTERQLRPHE